MRLKLSFGGVWVLGVTALTTRLFTGIALDEPKLQVAGWISVLISIVLYLPILLACRAFLSRTDNSVPMEILQENTGIVPTLFLKAILLGLLLWDAAGVAMIAIETMGYATMVEIRGIYFLLPLCAVMFAILSTNGGGVSGIARLWGWIFPLLFLLVLIQRFPNYVFQWLRPVLGFGGEAVVNGGITSAGLLSPVVALWLVAERKEGMRRSKWKTPMMMVIVAALLAAVLVVLHSAMVPVQVSGQESRIFRLDSILTNGRTILGSQLPVLIIWYISQLIVLAFELFLSAVLLQRLIPKLSGIVCALLVCITSCTIAWNGFAGQKQMVFLAKWAYLLANVPLLLALTVGYFKGLRGKNACKESG